MEHKTFVFIGPTISKEEATAYFPAIYLPPATQGDVLRAAQHSPRAIGIIDGCFENQPTVWHKEILWAMERGIYVYGSSSMGALRASELHTFGMIGVGRIFEWYRDGIIDRDDEVALLHLPKTHGCVAITEPLVNIRSTLEHAVEIGIVTADGARNLLSVASNLNYKDRTYQTLISTAYEQLGKEIDFAAFAKWYPTNSVNQKKLDAIDLLRRMNADESIARRPFEAHFRTERTEWWQSLENSADAFPIDEEVSDQVIELFFNHLRLFCPNFRELRQSALIGLLAREWAIRDGFVASDRQIQEEADQFRRSNSLEEVDSMGEWLRVNHQSVSQFTELMRRNVNAKQYTATVASKLQNAIVDQCRIRGKYSEILSLSKIKGSKLMHLRQLNASNKSADQQNRAFEWYFSLRGEPIPQNISQFALNMGFPSIEAFTNALNTEYMFSTIKG